MGFMHVLKNDLFLKWVVILKYIFKVKAWMARSKRLTTFLTYNWSCSYSWYIDMLKNINFVFMLVLFYLSRENQNISVSSSLAVWVMTRPKIVWRTTLRNMGMSWMLSSCGTQTPSGHVGLALSHSKSLASWMLHRQLGHTSLTTVRWSPSEPCPEM